MGAELGHGTRRRGAWALASAVLLASLLALAVAATPAGAEQIRRPQGTFGSSEQPLFGRAGGLAVYQSGSNAGDAIVADQGANEVQRVTVSATAGQFRLCFEAQCSGDLKFDATHEEVQEALWGLSTVGEQELTVEGGPGDGTGSHPYQVVFTNKLGLRNVEALGCEDGTAPLSGGAGCAVATVADGVPATLSRYHADGTPADFSALGTNTIDGRKGPGGKPCGEEPASCDDMSPLSLFVGPGSETEIAIDESSGTPTEGDIYLSDAHNSQVQVFSASGAYLGKLGETESGGKKAPFGEIKGVAVDSAGMLYVGDYANKKIHKFLPTANPPKPGDFKADCKPGIGHIGNLAAGAGPTAGYLFATGDEKGVVKLKASNCELQGEPIPGSINPNNVLALNPASGDLFVGQGLGTKIKEYDWSGLASVLVSTATTAKIVGGLASRGAGAADRLLVSQGLKGESRAQVFGPTVTVPTVETKAPSAITPTKATLNGTVNPEGQAVTECRFEYVTQAQFSAGGFAGASSVPCEGSIPADHSAHPVSARLTGLEELGRYHFRLLAADECEPLEHPGEQCESIAGELAFETTRAAETREAIEVGGSSATLTGAVNPDGTAVGDCHFEYTTEAAFGAGGWVGATSVPCGEYESAATWHPLGSLSELGEGEVAVPVQSTVTGLQPGTKYRFRLVASNGHVIGSAAEQGKTFTTLKTVETKPASEVGGHVARLNGTVNPFGKAVGECFFEYGETAEYGQIAPCEEPDAAEIGPLSTPVAVHADLTGLDATTAYHFRLVAKIGTETSHGADLTFGTLGPRIEAQWSGGVTATEAILRAKIDPEGKPSAYRLTWGPASAPEEHVTAPAPVGEDSSPHTVAVPLEGLQPGTEYSYRFSAASNCNEAQPAEECEVEGPEQSFLTYALPEPQGECPNQALRSGPAANLPDCRAYELVSPLDKNGGSVAPPGALRGGRGMTGQSSLSGERVAFGSVSSFAGAKSANFKNQYIATRGEEGWSTESVAPPLETPGVQNQPLGLANEFYAYSPDLSSAWFWNENAKPLTADAQPGHSNLYRREDAGGAYEALTVTAPTNEPNNQFGPGLAGEFVGAAADLSQQLFESRGALTPGAPLDEAVKKIYDFSGGGLSLVSVLPDGTADPAGSEAGSPLFLLEEGYGAMHHAVSADGSRVFWTSLGTVYVRENPDREESAAKDGAGNCLPEAGKACTLQLSPGSHSLFLTATPDGSEALLLTEGSLEVVEVGSGTRTQVAAGVPSVKEAQFADTGFLGGSEDLTRIYFASTEDLAAGATEGADNLYAYREGTDTFIGTLSGADVSGFRSPVALSANAHDARVSPSGESLAFVSASPALAERAAGYDNHDASSGEADREAYLYSAEAEQLRCVSCNPSGSRPVGVHTSGPVGQEPPAAALIATEPNVYDTSRPLSEDGSRVFFEAYDSLVPHDTNGTWDVYEWEAPGHGSCRESHADFSARDGGCIDLISTGTDPQPSEFFDADPGGKNVFIRTAASLDHRDEGAYDVYDAREEGGFAQPEAPASCEGEACQSPPGPPAAITPASSAFEGPGNLEEAPPKPKKHKRHKKHKKHGKSHRKHRAKRHRRAAR